MKQISIVAPIYNEAENVQLFHEAVVAAADACSGDYAFEFVYVDDGSKDGSLVTLRRLAVQDTRVKLIAFSRNFGHQAALTAGMEAAGGDAVITLDSDFQDPPEIIPEMVAKWEAGFKVVYARRRQREDKPFKKITASLYYKFLSAMSDIRIPHQVADFRLMDRVVVDNLVRLDEHARYLRGMVAWLGFEPAYVDFDRPLRLHGETHYSLMRMVRFAMDGMLSFSFKPLRLAFWVGVLAIVLAIGFAAAMLYMNLVNDVPFPLYKWLTVALFGFMGAQFILLWIVGEYIGRIYADARSRPLYVVAERVNLD